MGAPVTHGGIWPQGPKKQQNEDVEGSLGTLKQALQRLLFKLTNLHTSLTILIKLITKKLLKIHKIGLNVCRPFK